MPTPERQLIESMFMIADKDGNDVPFVLNPHQAEVDENLGLKNVIPKPRQEGISSYFLALFTVRCLTKRNTRAVIISHDREATQKLLSRVHYYLDNLRGAKAVLSYASKNEIGFPKTNSTMYIGTQGSREFGRGDTISDLLCSEVASWTNPKELLAGLFQAVPITSGTIALESTGKGAGTWYHKRVIRAQEGKSEYILHFPDWRDTPEYCIKMTPEEELEFMSNLDPHLEEDSVSAIFGLSAGQLKWRRIKLEEMDYDLSLFRQEYPLTVDECFQSRGYSMFHKVIFEPTGMWKEDKEDINYSFHSSHCNPNFHYVMGVDVAAGVGKDRSVIEVVCCETNEQVAEYVSDTVAPDIFARKIAWVGEQFGFPLVVVESNNHGAVTLDNLKKCYPVQQIYKDKLNSDNITHSGYRTTKRTKPIAIGQLRKMLAEELIIHSKHMRSELSTFIETDSGSMQATDGCFDDRVMAMAMAVVGIQKQWKYIEYETGKKTGRKIDQGPFSFDSIINELTSGRNQYPVKDQLWN